jgi:hypothetical protein
LAARASASMPTVGFQTIAVMRRGRDDAIDPERNSAAIRCVIPVVRVGCGTAGVYLLTCYPPKWGCHCEFSLSHILVVASGAMPMRSAENW